MKHKTKHKATCQAEMDSVSEYRRKLSPVISRIIDSYQSDDGLTHIDYDPIPSVEAAVELIDRLKEIIFPGFFGKSKIDPINLEYKMGQAISSLYDLLSHEITNSIRHECIKYNQTCMDCINKGNSSALQFMETIPSLRSLLADDVRATYNGDPAANSFDEIIFSYPGIFAMIVYRIAHQLFSQKIPLLPRIMSEYAHTTTGIDIHPGATIGKSFVIDHGTGIVIGETTIIGNNVRIYQGVTLGAHSLPTNAGNKMKGEKRHPTIENNVIIYAGATILGGNTTIGENCIIGGNVWITKSIPPDTKVIMEPTGLKFN